MFHVFCKNISPPVILKPRSLPPSLHTAAWVIFSPTPWPIAMTKYITHLPSYLVRAGGGIPPIQYTRAGGQGQLEGTGSSSAKKKKKKKLELMLTKNPSGPIQVRHQLTPPPTPDPRILPPPRLTLRITLQLALVNRCSRLGLQAPTCEEADSYCGPSFHHLLSFTSFLPTSPLPQTPWGAIERSKPRRVTRARLLCIVARDAEKRRGEIVGGYVAHGQDWTDWIDKLCLQIWWIFNVIKTGELSTCTC